MATMTLDELVTQLRAAYGARLSSVVLYGSAAGGDHIKDRSDYNVLVLLESLDEFTGTFFVGVPDVITLPLLMFTASIAGNYQIAAITALVLLVPSVVFMLIIERFLKADVLSKVGA